MLRSAAVIAISFLTDVAGAAAKALDWQTPKASALALTEFSPAKPAENPLAPPSEPNSPRHTGAVVAAGSASTAVAMMMAGNLLVTVHGLREAEGNLLVRLTVGNQKQQTNIHWSGESGEWNEQINFYQVLCCCCLHAHASGRGVHCNNARPRLRAVLVLSSDTSLQDLA